MQKFWKNITLSIVNQPFFCAGYQFFNSSFKKKIQKAPIYSKYIQYMFKGHATTIYKTPRMPCATVCNNHSTRYTKETLLMWWTKSTKQKHIRTSDASHTICRDPAEVSDLGKSELSSSKGDFCSPSSVWHRSDLVSAAQLLKDLTDIFTRNTRNEPIEPHIHYVTKSASDQQVPAWSEAWDLLTAHLLAVWSLLFSGRTAHHHGRNWK